MRYIADTLDDLCRKVFPALLRSREVVPTSRGGTHELTGVLLELKNPRARLGRTETRGKMFSCLGELLWYLSRDNRLDFIEYYIPLYGQESDDGESIRGGYGRRLFSHPSHDQVRTLIETLKGRGTTRRAVLQIFEASDTASQHREVPCTLSMQFLLRNGKLHLYVIMRSQDAVIGLPHDVFCFTMLQEIIARSIGAEMGEYKEFVGSLHMYAEHRELVQKYMSESIQQTVPMPPMPLGDPWPSIEILLDASARLRAGNLLRGTVNELDTYWMDLVRLLQIFAEGGGEAVSKLKRSIKFKGYHVYVDGRKNSKRREPVRPRQGSFDFS